MLPIHTPYHYHHPELEHYFPQGRENLYKQDAAKATDIL
jgi:hypothetical protein